MNQQTMDTLTLIFAGEAALMLTLICIMVFWKSFRAKRADQSAGDDLAKSVIKTEGERHAALKEAFSECYEMDDSELIKVVDEFIARERAFYKTLISVYVNRDAEQFKNLGDSLQEMVQPYTDLAKSAEPLANSEALEALEQKNEALSKELDESKDVMEGLMDEYKASFEKESKPEKDASESVDMAEDFVTEDDESSDTETEAVEDLDLALDDVELPDEASEEAVNEDAVEDLVEETPDEVTEDVAEEVELPAEPEEAASAEDATVDDIDDLLAEINAEAELTAPDPQPEAEQTEEETAVVSEIDVDDILAGVEGVQEENMEDESVSEGAVSEELVEDAIQQTTEEVTENTDDLIVDAPDEVKAEAEVKDENDDVLDEMEALLKGKPITDSDAVEAILDEEELDAENAESDVDIDLDIDSIMQEADATPTPIVEEAVAERVVESTEPEEKAADEVVEATETTTEIDEDSLDDLLDGLDDIDLAIEDSGEEIDLDFDEEELDESTV